MNLKEAKKISHILTKCLSILSVFILGTAIFFLLSSALVWLYPTIVDKITPYFSGIQVHGMELVVGNNIFSIPALSGSSLLVAIKMSALFLVVYYGRRIFKHIQLEETPFQPCITKYIRLIAIFLTVYQLIWSWENGFISMLISLIIPLILFCISFIFQYGCILQKEIDETL